MEISFIYDLSYKKQEILYKTREKINYSIMQIQSSFYDIL